MWQAHTSCATYELEESANSKMNGAKKKWGHFLGNEKMGTFSGP